MDASAANAETLLRQACSPLSRSTYRCGYAFLPRDCARWAHDASPRFRDEAL